MSYCLAHAVFRRHCSCPSRLLEGFRRKPCSQMRGQTQTFLICCVSLHISVAVAFQPLTGRWLCGSFSKISYPTIFSTASPPLRKSWRKPNAIRNYWSMSGAGRRGDSQSGETALPSAGGSNYKSVAQKVKAACVVWGATRLAETVTLDTAVKEMLSHLPESKQNLGDALISKLIECLEQSYKHEPAFSANLMETLGILGDTATATEVSLVRPGRVLGHDPGLAK
eukprot:1369683-Rhodomonas_salina.1